MNRIRSTLVVLSGCATLAAPGCDSHVPLGTLGPDVQNVLWYATFEPGNVSEWTGDGNGGVNHENDVAAPVAVTEQAHSGAFSGKPTIGPTTGSFGMPAASYLYRNGPSPVDAYYGAWFYIPSTVTVRSWLSLMHFRSSPTGDGLNPTPYWDLNLYPNWDATLLPVGALTTHFYNYLTGTNAEQLVVPMVPTDRWVHFEILIHKATDTTGHVSVWEDDVMIIDVTGVATVLSPWMQWEVGGASTDLAPATSSIYVDDATISRERLGSMPIPANERPQP